MTATKAQRELLEWLVEQEGLWAKMHARGDGFSGGALINYYAERAARDGRHTSGTRGGGYAQHGWRRAGGTALMHLEKKGFIKLEKISYGVPIYVLTDLGRQQVVKPSQIRRSPLGTVTVRERYEGSPGRWWAVRDGELSQRLWTTNALADLPLVGETKA